MVYPAVGDTNTTSGITVVDCHKQVRSWRLLRSLTELLIPSCKNCTFIEEQDPETTSQTSRYYNNPQPSVFRTSNNNIITGTIFGYRRGKVSFCIQTNSKSTSNPILLLELAIPTTVLAREMRGGFVRIALECATPGYPSSGSGNCYSLLSMPVWAMYCNGRKVGYAMKLRPSKPDLDALRLMSSVVAGAGIITGKELNRVDDDDDQLIYLRGNFERVYGSAGHSQSFHLIDPEGCMGQELSISFIVHGD
ncbi:hypothetical protein FNV43_RR17510 [Rhamnella rubrinervis]|uniref:Protein MIZU-KUSSEI 1-like n=1 Tax=Rhamnella rubrinervis TaxID=2594499 RepID=A0A8K0DXN7_9ROSA|nr:hypothetical protein FNV43_RR17510 [Rhamnella rubrinervis]